MCVCVASVVRQDALSHSNIHTKKHSWRPNFNAYASCGTRKARMRSLNTGLGSTDREHGRGVRASCMSSTQEHMLHFLLPCSAEMNTFTHTSSLDLQAKHKHKPHTPAHGVALGGNPHSQAGQIYTSSIERRALHAHRVVCTAVSRVCACDNR